MAIDLIRYGTPREVAEILDGRDVDVRTLLRVALNLLHRVDVLEARDRALTDLVQAQGRTIELLMPKARWEVTPGPQWTPAGTPVYPPPGSPTVVCGGPLVGNASMETNQSPNAKRAANWGS